MYALRIVRSIFTLRKTATRKRNVLSFSIILNREILVYEAKYKIRLRQTKLRPFASFSKPLKNHLKCAATDISGSSPGGTEASRKAGIISYG